MSLFPSAGEPGGPLRAMLVRVGVGLALAGPAVLCAILGGWAFGIWVLAFGLLMAYEWHTIAYRAGASRPLAVHGVGLAVAIILTLNGQIQAALLVIPLVAAGTMLAAGRAGLDQRWALLGALYVTVPLVVLLWLRSTAVPMPGVILWLFAVVWATDSTALLVGRTIGGPRLAPRLSPQKTWAGLLGGIAGAALAGLATGALIPGASSLLVAGLSAILAVVSQLGDLTESAFKRRFGVKDSGQLIPGQGGVLDRVDGLVFATLAVAMLALLRDGDVLFVSTPS